MPSDNETRKRLVTVGVVALVESSTRARLLAGIRVLVGDRFAGPAVTAGLPAGDNLAVHLALDAAGAGDVVCLASAGRGLYGVVGDLLADSARARAVDAFVLDDGVRDVESLAAPPAIAARRVSGHGTVKRRVRASVNSDVAVGGALVCAGDWIVGDRDGICVVPADEADAALASAEARLAGESDAREALRGGVSTREYLGLGADARSSIAEA
jgi:4-hydroxy-4-methyl-2-oxoglutarate aldolase